MTWALKKTVVLVGMMGSGKTAVGNALARLLECPFRDSDEEIVKAANQTIAEIFERDGEEFFRDKETQVIDRLLNGAPGILSTGGGAFMSERNRDLIEAKGVAVWLKADIDLLWARVRHKTTRPLLRTPNPLKTLKDLNQSREPIYQLADLHVTAKPEYSIADMTNMVAETMLSRPDVLERT